MGRIDVVALANGWKKLEVKLDLRQRSDVVGLANGWKKVQMKLDRRRRCSARQQVEERAALSLVAAARERCVSYISFGLRP